MIALLLLGLTACSFSAVPGAPPARPSPESATLHLTETPGVLMVSSAETAVPAAEYEVTAAHLNIRASPGWNWPAVGWLDEGDVIRVLEIRDGWARIASGWVSLRYIQKR
jgi:uncharacterized protein YraI